MIFGFNYSIKLRYLKSLEVYLISNYREISVLAIVY